MSETTTTSTVTVTGINDRVNAIMQQAGVTTVPEVAETIGVEVKELYRALKADRDNTDYDGPALEAVAAYEAANPAPAPEEGAEASEQPAKKAKKQAREPKAKKAAAPKEPKPDKPVTLPTEVGKMQFSTGGRMDIKNGQETLNRSVYGVRLQEDGSYTGHIVHKSREYLATLPKGGNTWTVTGPKPSSVERKQAAAPKKEKAAPKAKAAPAAEAGTEDAGTVKAAPKPSKKSKK